jgi:hypothetical protein
MKNVIEISEQVESKFPDFFKAKNKKLIDYVKKQVSDKPNPNGSITTNFYYSSDLPEEILQFIKSIG